MPPAAVTNLGYTPPDGGWGWAVVLGSFISIGFSYAFPKSLTIYFKEIQEYFSVSYSEIAWVSSVMLASMYAGGQWPSYVTSYVTKSFRKFVKASPGIILNLYRVSNNIQQLGLAFLP